MKTSRPRTDDRPERRFAGTTRFEVREQLGRGASGVVYSAFDRETGRQLALKTLSAIDPERLYHLKSEFRSLAQLHHKNLVELYELVATSDDCFFTMELLSGRTLDGYMRTLVGEAEGATLDRAGATRLRGVFSQFIVGLSALHEAGKLHRDIKPTNLFVTDEERGVIVDFGLCAELQRLELTRSPLVGTLLYMAPEQAWGKPLCPAADVYALGAVLYEAVVGYPAFRGRRGSTLLFAKEAMPEVPSALASHLVPLARLAAELMHPDPSMRPSAAVVLEALQHDGPSSGTRPRAAQTDGAGRDSSRPWLLPLVGRERETAVLQAALDDVDSGRPAIVEVQGAAGMGKTELVERFLGHLEARNTTLTSEAPPAHAPNAAVVLRSRCHLQESVSYNGFDGIIDDMSEWLASLPQDRVREMLPEDPSALVALFPVLGRSRAFSRTNDPSPRDAFALRQRALIALRELLTNVGERHPLVLFIDDAHWGDADTGVLLAEVLAQPTPRVLLVLSYRIEDAKASMLLQTISSRAPFLLDSVHRTHLGPLDHAASTTFAMHCLTGTREEARATAERISVEARGHPLYLRELAEAATKPESPASAPRGLQGLLRQRIDALSVAERTLLALVSLSGRPVARHVVLAASGQGEHGRTEIFALARKRLVREAVATSGVRLEPYQGHVREAVLGTLDDGTRRNFHRALADALLLEPEPDADALVDQLVGAGDRRTAARFALVAAERASRALAFDRAAQLYRRTLALRAADAPEQLSPLRAKLAVALANSGRSVEAAHVFAEAAHGAAPAEAPALERAAAEHFLRGGRFEEGAGRLRRVLGAVGVPYPRSAALAFATMVRLRTRLALRGMEFRRRQVSDIPPGDLARIDACWTAGLGLSLVDRTRTAAFQARYMLLALEAGDPSRIARGLSTEASELACLGGRARTTKARELMAKAFALDDSGDPQTHAFNLLMAGTIDFYASRWTESLDFCTRASERLRSLGSQSEWELVTSDMLAFVCLAYRGDLRTLRDRQATALNAARERGNVIATSCLASGPANISWLVVDDPDQAARRAADGRAPWASDTFQVAHYLDLVAQVQTALYCGDARGAMDRLSRQWPRLVTSMSLLVQNFRVTLHHLRARSAIALAARTPGKRERSRLCASASRDAARLANDDVAWARPLATSVTAGTRALRGDDAGAIEALAVAADQYRALSMHLHATAADYERGRMLGGDEGRELVHRAETALLDEHVVSPERLCGLLFPPVR